jgi:hypothetical protein
VLSIQPRVTGGAGGGGGLSSDEQVSRLAAELQAGLPPLLSREEAALGLFDRTDAGQLNSLSVVLGQEMDRFNRLSTAVRGGADGRRGGGGGAEMAGGGGAGVAQQLRQGRPAPRCSVVSLHS